LTGGASDYRVAYAAVAACAVLALPLVYRHAAVELGGARAGLAVTALFLLMPTAWISVKGILSESLYLLMLMAAVVHFEARIAAGRSTAADLLVFGTLVACATLTRCSASRCSFAYFAHLAVQAVARRRLPALRDLLPAAAGRVPALALVRAAAPSRGGYLWPYAGSRSLRSGSPIRRDAAGRRRFLLLGLDRLLYRGGRGVHAGEGRIALIGAMALGGVILRVVRNRLDGWFLLASLGILFPWVFTPDNTRRLL
jgi:hypothetical protein